MAGFTADRSSAQYRVAFVRNNPPKAKTYVGFSSSLPHLPEAVARPVVAFAEIKTYDRRPNIYKLFLRIIN
jgi:hypothetical protein